METDLIKRESVAGLCAIYESLVADIERAENLLEEATKRADGLGRYVHIPRFESSRREWRKELKATAWNAVAERLGIRSLMSMAQVKEWDSQMQDDKLPDFNEGNVLATFQALCRSVPDMIEECIREVWSDLKPGAYEDLKTNLKNQVELGEKIIMRSAIECWGAGNYYVSHWSADRIRQFGKAFALLDGKPIPQYQGDFETALNAAGRDNKRECSTAYFACKWFGNGNLHIRFLRPDLVQKMNEIAGRGMVRPAADVA